MPNSAPTPATTPTRNRTWRTWLGLAWLVIFAAGALDHSVIPTLTRGARLNLPVPATQYGFVMFAQAPRIVAIPGWIPAGESEERHLASLARTPAIGYRKSRVVQTLYATEGAYLSYLCGTRLEAQGARFFVRAYDMHAPQVPPAIDTYRCEGGRLAAP